MIFMTGGAGSGKSRAAVDLAMRSGRPVTFIATAEPLDAEMAAKIGRHRAERPAEWTTVEEPVEIAGAIRSAPADSFVVLDCLTLWVSNLLGKGWADGDIDSAAAAAAAALAPRAGAVVSNEVGLGIVPASELSRRYAARLAAVNGVFAAAASGRVLMVAGMAVELSPVRRVLGID